ncbi:hypothetical protein SHKM778_92520 [Streptomyces sp. KM77-8]|uniref:FAD-binding PCMH-type domain-containing protein n=1 Tax=Streptomyces haneummycinicus TaxID=3074435 RepID=A0AAT9I0K9_9ACTN
MSATAATTFDSLREALRGRVVTPQDTDYDEVRSIYNAMIDRRPAAIARCAGAADVRTTLAFARETGIDLAVRGGGHSGPGLCLVDGGLTLDLSPMRWVRVDPETETAQVGGGAELADLDHETHAFGLGVPAGIMSTTGVGGLTLGGGHGHLTRAYGLTIDSLIAADVVLADGTLVTATDKEHPDLLWALRGGGGNFGVVTSFTFRLRPVHTVGVAVTVWPVDRTAEVLRWYREFLPAAPESLNGFFAVLTVPPGPPFPEPIHGQKMCAVIWCYTGDPEPGRLEDVLSVVNEPAPPAFHFTTPMPYPALQTLFDGLMPKGLQWYWRGDFFDGIPDDAVAVHERYAHTLPTPLDNAPLPRGRGRPPGRPRRHGLGLPGRRLVRRHRRHRPRPRQRRPHPPVVRRLLDRPAPALHGRLVRQLPRRVRGPRTRPLHLPGQLRPPDHDQTRLRPGQLLPRHPEHPPSAA